MTKTEGLLSFPISKENPNGEDVYQTYPKIVEKKHLEQNPIEFVPNVKM